MFFSRFLDFCREQNYSKSWLDNTISGLRIFLLATHVSHTSTPEGIDMDTINCFSEAMRSADEICMNVRRMRCRQVAVYLHWLYQHGITKQDYSLQLPEFKRTPAKLPQTWSKKEIEQILAAIDTENPTGKRNYAMFLLMARTGLRISDVVSLRFSNIDWKTVPSLFRNRNRQQSRIAVKQRTGDGHYFISQRWTSPVIVGLHFPSSHCSI